MSDRMEIGNNWFYLTVPSRVGIMKMIGRHASVTLAQQQPAAVTAFSSHSVCTILLFAQNYAGHKIAALMNTRSTDATDVARNNRVHSSCEHRVPRIVSLFLPFFFNEAIRDWYRDNDRPWQRGKLEHGHSLRTMFGLIKGTFVQIYGLYLSLW